MESRSFSLPVFLIVAATAANLAYGQEAIPFESNGLKYRALTRSGITIMIAQLATHVRDWEIFQVAITNGTTMPLEMKAEDFRFERGSGSPIPALAAHEVIETLLKKASRNDATKLVVAYEAAINGNMQLHNANGYESRRQDALGFGMSKLDAAGAASAIVLAPAKLAPAQAIDGAVFFPNGGKPLGAGKLIANAGGEEFVFPVSEAVPGPKH